MLIQIEIIQFAFNYINILFFDWGLYINCEYWHASLRFIGNRIINMFQILQKMNVQFSNLDIIQQMDTAYVHPVTGPAGTDEIAIQLYSKHKLTQDVKAELSHHFTNKLPKASGNKMLLIGSKVGICARLMEPYCCQIDIVAEQKYIPILEATFIKGQTVEYTFNREGFIGEKHLIPVKKNPNCKVNIIEISTFKNYVPRDSHYDIILLQNVIVHPKINILKQLMRLNHDVLITMIVPGKLVHKNLFQLLSGIQQNILHVFYNQATHQRTEYLRNITGRRQQINIWEVFVWIKKNTENVRKQLAKVQTILQEEVGKNTVHDNETFGKVKGPECYETQESLQQYLDLHYGETEYFGVKNFPATCAHKTIEAAKSQNIKGRVLDVGCSVGRSTIQLAHYFDEAVGVQYSQTFVNAANKVLHQKYNDLSAKVKFLKGDACKLDQSLGKFDAVFAGNLIDRIPYPEVFLRSVVTTFMKEKSVLVLTSPYSWLQQYTKVENWLGGRQINGKDVTTYDRLKQLLGELGLKELRAPQDVRFVIQQNPWVYQYTASHMTYWVKF